jgi:hypothetical protein
VSGSSLQVKAPAVISRGKFQSPSGEFMRFERLLRSGAS